MTIQIHDIIGMGHATTTRILRETHLRGLGEVGGIGSTLTRLRLQVHPSIGGPCETEVAEGIAIAMESLIVGIAGIDFQGLIGHITKDATS